MVDLNWKKKDLVNLKIDNKREHNLKNRQKNNEGNIRLREMWGTI
jgi:hypothetical protein